MFLPRDASDDGLHSCGVSRSEHPRCKLQIHQNDVGRACLKRPYPFNNFAFEPVVRPATPGDVIGAQLPYNKVWRVGENVTLETCNVVWDRVADSTAVDDIDRGI